MQRVDLVVNYGNLAFKSSRRLLKLRHFLRLKRSRVPFKLKPKFLGMLNIQFFVYEKGVNRHTNHSLK